MDASAEPPAANGAADQLKTMELEERGANADSQQQEEQPSDPDASQKQEKLDLEGAAIGASQGDDKLKAPMDQDKLIEYCLLAGLHQLTDKDLPVLTSDFYPKFMYPARPAGTANHLSDACRLALAILCCCSITATSSGLRFVSLWHTLFDQVLQVRGCLHVDAGSSVDIKKSSYRKLSKLLSIFEKKVRDAIRIPR